MGSKLVFDDIAKNLLVFLKGQVISLSNKATKEEALRQVQSITFTLRSSIAQLENASASDPRAGSNGEEIVAEIDINDIESIKSLVSDDIYSDLTLFQNIVIDMSQLQEMKIILTQRHKFG